jgi:hypothetical protein
VFEGVDIAAVSEELRRYGEMTAPVENRTFGTDPRCGRSRAIELTERVRPILGRLYPDWETENSSSSYFEFSAERDACAKLLARLHSADEIAAMLPRESSPQLRAAEFHELVWSAASAQWSTGHRQEAVLAAAKAVNSMLQAKVDRRDVSDTKLVQESFSDKAPTTALPRLRFPMIEDDQTRESTRQGAMSFGVGCFQAIRNPVGHLPNEEHELSEQEALERLAAFSLMARWIDQAEVQSLP